MLEIHRSCSSTGRSAARPLRWGAVLASALILSACGGGFYFSLGIDNLPPVVTLATAATSVVAGQTVRFVAAAADESGIDRVAFYRVDTTGPLLLGSDPNEPYDIVVTAPTDGRTMLSVFARATDNQGNEADSAVVTIPVTP